MNRQEILAWLREENVARDVGLSSMHLEKFALGANLTGLRIRTEQTKL